MPFPLDVVYARSGVVLPRVTAIDPDDIPLPYRTLLVHEFDMTLTPKRHCGGRLALRPLSTFTIDPWYFRRVLLAQEGVFWMREPKTLYGRRTEMIHEDAKVGDIVEVLPLI